MAYDFFSLSFELPWLFSMHGNSYMRAEFYSPFRHAVIADLAGWIWWRWRRYGEGMARLDDVWCLCSRDTCRDGSHLSSRSSAEWVADKSRHRNSGTRFPECFQHRSGRKCIQTRRSSRLENPVKAPRCNFRRWVLVRAWQYRVFPGWGVENFLRPGHRCL